MTESQDRTEYNLPRNDATEYTRLDDQAAGITEIMHNKVVHAPLKDPSKMIDVGCGTGVINRHFGTQYPSATVYGIDISPVPSFVSTPANVSYIEGDVRKLIKSDERLATASLDYIYQRLLICGMTNWDSHIKDGDATSTWRLD